MTLTTPPVNVGNLTAVVTTDGLSSGTAVQIGTVVPVVQFSAASESVAPNSSSSFSVTATVTPGIPATSTFVTGLNDPLGLAFVVEVLAQDDELVAGDPGQSVTWAQQAGHPVGDSHQKGVAATWFMAWFSLTCSAGNITI